MSGLQLLADVQTGKPHKRRSLSVSRQMLNSDSFRSLNSTPLSADLDNDILASHPNISRATSGHTHTLSFGNGSAHYKDVSSLESEVESLRAELEETKRRTQVEVAQAREEALGVMRATGQSGKAVVVQLIGSMQLDYAVYVKLHRSSIRGTCVLVCQVYMILPHTFLACSPAHSASARTASLNGGHCGLLQWCCDFLQAMQMLR